MDRKKGVDARHKAGHDGLSALAESARPRHFQDPAQVPWPDVIHARMGSDMKVTVERAALLKSVGHVHRVVERRNTIPILANVLIRAEKGKLALKATDLDLEVMETIPAEVSPGGATTVPAHMIYDIVRKLPEGSQIVLDSSGDRASLTIRAGRSRFSLQTLPESDFPDLAAGEMTHKFTLAAKDLKRLIDKTQFAISTEETRYYLNGIYLHTAGTAKAQTLRAVATDGHRLAQVELAAPAGADGMPGVIVPRKTVNEVQRLIEDANGEITVDQKKLANDDALFPIAKDAHARNADLRAVIKADGTVQHQRVIHVLDLLKQSGVTKIAFGVTPIAAEPGAVTAPAGSR